MDIAIFIKSCKKDFKLLKYNLLSIKKNVSGYTKLVLLIPERDKHDFDTRDLPINTEVHYVNEYGNGYLYQQWCKMNAYNYCNTYYIFFADSDNIFDHKLNMQELVIDNKPEILHTNWDKVGEAICWKKCTETLLDDVVPYEFMRRVPVIYHASTLNKIALQYPNLEYMIMESERFSEFNLMGAWAYKYDRENYTFINTDNWTYTPPHAVQLWSWANKNDNSEVHKIEYQRSLDTINKTLELNLTEL
jgi:hypothetical protein